MPGLRPTSERIRETLFNWLAPVTEGSACLDLFAGTGALGLEALSRGAATVDFVEASPKAAAAIGESLVALDAAGGNVIEADALAWIDRPATRQYDVVFLDPPFAADMGADLCRLLAERGWLASGAKVYLEQARSQAIPELPEGWALLRERKTANVRYSLIRA